jgi:hypothetical protein
VNRASAGYNTVLPNPPKSQVKFWCLVVHPRLPLPILMKLWIGLKMNCLDPLRVAWGTNQA